MTHPFSGEEKEFFKLLETLFTTSQEATCVVQEERFVYANSMFLILFGFTYLDEILAKKMEDIFSDELLGEAGKKIRTILHGASSPFQQEITMLRSAGTFETYKCNISEIIYRTSPAYVIRMQNVTDYCHTIEGLREIEEIFRFLNEQSGVGFYITKSGKIIFVSEGLPEVLGVTKDEFFAMTTMKEGDFSCYLPGILHPGSSGDRDIHDLPPGTCECKIFTDPGKPAWLLFQVKKITFRDESGVLAIVMDMTDQVLKEKEDSPLQTSLKDADMAPATFSRKIQRTLRLESLGRLTEGFIHDLVNGMTGITGHTSLIKSELAPDHPLYDDIDRIEKSAMRIQDCTRQILLFSHEKNLEPDAVNLNGVVESVHAIISRSFGPTISIDMNLEENLFSVRGLLSHLEHILMTLCLNARDGMPAGGAISLSTFNINFENNHVRENVSVPAGRYAVLEVDITLKGKEEKLAGGRSGIGSKIVSAIVENHQGFIDEKKTPGNEFSYLIYFPQWKKSFSNFSASVTKPASSRIAGTVLLIDDEEGLLTMGRNMLAKMGYKTVIAKSGEEACALFGEISNEIDLILLDIILPGMGGEETLISLKRIRPDIKIVLTSAVVFSGAKKKLFEMGVKGFLQKPFLFQDLKKIVKDVMKEQSRPG